MKKSFPKSSRLLKPSDFYYLKDKPKKVTSKYFVAYYKSSKLQTSEESRIGISVSKKVGNAVLRNRIRRQIRECFRQSEIKLKGLDILTVAKKGNNEIARELISRDLNNLFLRMN